MKRNKERMARVQPKLSTVPVTVYNTAGKKYTAHVTSLFVDRVKLYEGKRCAGKLESYEAQLDGRYRDESKGLT